MSTPESGRHSDIARFVSYLSTKGSTLWSEDGKLRYRAPKGALTPADVAVLRSAKEQIVEFLQERGAFMGTLPAVDDLRESEAPLTYGQLEYWSSYRLRERRDCRQLFSATRLTGTLCVESLQKAVSVIVRRHDALRTAIVLKQTGPVQRVSARDYITQLDDLSDLGEGKAWEQVKQLIADLVLEPIDVSTGPMFTAKIVKTRPEEHVLIFVCHHIICDGFSRNLILRDIQMAYAQLAAGTDIYLDPIALQYPEYASLQRRSQNAHLQQHGRYWQEHLLSCPRVRFPHDVRATDAGATWGAVPLEIGATLTSNLRKWCQLKGTSLAMAVFTTYVAATLRWCRVSEGVLAYQFNSRTTPEVANTVGLFTSALYLRLQLRDSDTFDDLLTRVVEEFCTAYGHADFTCLAAQSPRPEVTRNTIFNWFPRPPSIEQASDRRSSASLTYSPIRLAHPLLQRIDVVLDYEPSIQLHETDDAIIGQIYFPLARFSVELMQEFSRFFMALVQVVVVEAGRNISEIAPSGVRGT